MSSSSRHRCAGSSSSSSWCVGNPHRAHTAKKENQTYDASSKQLDELLRFALSLSLLSGECVCVCACVARHHSVPPVGEHTQGYKTASSAVRSSVRPSARARGDDDGQGGFSTLGSRTRGDIHFEIEIAFAQARGRNCPSAAKFMLKIDDH